jgi:hypothetical protein
MNQPENPSAFPRPDDRDAMGCGIREGSDGMTLRDWFAGQALVGLMSHNAHDHCPLFGDGEPFARDAYLVADAMLAERAKGGAA